MNRVAIFIGPVLTISWAFTAYLFSSPERIKIFGHIMFIPATVALILRIAHGESWRELVRPISSRFNSRALIFALIYPLTFIAACAAIGWTFGWAHPDTTKLVGLVPKLTLTDLIWNFWKMFGEEYGWRGTLLPELRRTRGPFASAAIVGIVWAIWHGPVLYGLGHFFGVAHPLGLCLIQMGAVFVLSFPFAYVYFISGSIIPTMIFHFIWNLYNPIVLGDIYRNSPGIMTGNILLINGEGLLGSLLGIVFIIWIARSWNERTAPLDSDTFPTTASIG